VASLSGNKKESKEKTSFAPNITLTDCFHGVFYPEVKL